MRQAFSSLLTLCLLVSQGHSNLKAAERTLFEPAQWRPASNDQLDKARGGFNLDSGLNVSFGIIRTVTINGDLVSQTRFDLPDITSISPDQARLVNTALGHTGVIQSGSGNFIDPATVMGLNGGTVIQNSLNDQQIQTLTVINTGVNSLALLKSINTQDVLTDALVRAVRGL